MATVFRLFDSHTEALDAVSKFEASSVAHDKISIVSNNADNWHAGSGRSDAGPLGDRNGDGENEVADGAGKGRQPPGCLARATASSPDWACLPFPVSAPWSLRASWPPQQSAPPPGGATGGLLGALKEAGHSDEDADVYAEDIRRGGPLVSVKTDDDKAHHLQALHDGSRGFDATTRGEAYRQSGWSGFDVYAQRYTSEQIALERAKYR